MDLKLLNGDEIFIASKPNVILINGEVTIQCSKIYFSKIYKILY